VALSRARRQRQQQAAAQGGAAEGIFGDNPLAMFLVRLLAAVVLVFLMTMTMMMTLTMTMNQSTFMPFMPLPGEAGYHVRPMIQRSIMPPPFS
jgi:hypothetical protein